MKKNAIRVLSLALVVAMVTALTACGGSENGAQVGGTPSSIASPPSSSSEPAHIHDWREANYQEPQTCPECGETEGDPLTPAFEAAGYEINMEDGRIYPYGYPYITACTNDLSLSTVGKVHAYNYRIVEAEQGFDAKTGYEWRIVDITLDFSDENAQIYGSSSSILLFDYYKEFTEDTREDAEDPSHIEDMLKINYFGDEVLCPSVFDITEDEGWQQRILIVDGNFVPLLRIRARYAVCVPIGYDGIVICFYNWIHNIDDAGNKTETVFLPRLVDEDTLFFRMVNL